MVEEWHEPEIAPFPDIPAEMPGVALERTQPMGTTLEEDGRDNNKEATAAEENYQAEENKLQSTNQDEEDFNSYDLPKDGHLGEDSDENDILDEGVIKENQTNPRNIINIKEENEIKNPEQRNQTWETEDNETSVRQSGRVRTRNLQYYNDMVNAMEERDTKDMMGDDNTTHNECPEKYDDEDVVANIALFGNTIYFAACTKNIWEKGEAATTKKYMTWKP